MTMTIMFQNLKGPLIKSHYNSKEMQRRVVITYLNTTIKKMEEPFLKNELVGMQLVMVFCYKKLF